MISDDFMNVIPKRIPIVFVSLGVAFLLHEDKTLELYEISQILSKIKLHTRYFSNLSKIRTS